MVPGVAPPYPQFLGDRQRAALAAKTRPGENGCLEWTGTLCAGYPYMRVGGILVGAYRVAWVLAHNVAIPDGHDLDWLCDNQLCVNAEHLEPVTRQERLRRSRERRGIPSPPREIAGERQCRDCGRQGTRAFTRAESEWVCSNTAACAERVQRAVRH